MDDRTDFGNMDEHKFAFAIKQAINELQDVDFGEPVVFLTEKYHADESENINLMFGYDSDIVFMLTRAILTMTNNDTNKARIIFEDALEGLEIMDGEYDDE